ncbi:MAG: CRISPR-associated helicase/endonuclease Cas3, partial [Candidatus Omnitrophica bacterium]|nr:CRISPR-associated helicase/endonuclease Cas3 [Candidatus Omnitrophota bacterium]
DAVLEHHSNIDPDEETKKSRLASENWDAPIVVTTNVQLFESLLASRTSSCRKLHNIANSVIILDEAQMLSPEYLQATLSVLRGLVEHFGVTIVMCTATQPALSGRIGGGTAVFEGLLQTREIVRNVPMTTDVFKRYEVSLYDLTVPIEWPTLVAQLGQYSQVLCIVNTRRDCQELHRLMPEGTIHLSANMCGEERSEVVTFVKETLRTGGPIRVVSTQLVEAGVDIDFPVVYRALAGLDSIAQAAGRCNREGRLNAGGSLGRVVVFAPPKPAPIGFLRKGEDASRSLMGGKDRMDFGPDLYRRYFEVFYKSVNSFDKPKFIERMVSRAGDCKFQFRTFANDVRLIDDRVQRGIIVYYKGKERSSVPLIDQLHRFGPEAWLLRKLQRFIVNVPLPVFNRLANEGHIEDIHGYWVQKSTGLYRTGYGLLPDPLLWHDDMFLI